MRVLIPSTLALALSLASAPTALSAQALVQAVPGSTDADRLGDTMRRLATNPGDLSALLDAGELSLRVDDLSGAASLFARADKVDPRNARAKAGMGAILVRAERPGEALRYFAQAESLGLAPARMAADRGFAYDLIGEQERAQRDYRLALKTESNDELLRRYALSLGISGRREQALAVLEPLIRRSDRGAWRARAFVLAMTGDVPGATTIASTMMPGGTAQGLQPFFQQLPSLGASDRAFAVHFGEIRPTPERLADARLAPALMPLAPEPQPQVAVASVQPARTDDRRDDRRGRSGRDRRAEREARRAAALASVRPALTSAPARVAATTVVQPVPARVGSVGQPAPTQAASVPQPGQFATARPVQTPAFPSQVGPSQPATPALAANTGTANAGVQARPFATAPVQVPAPVPGALATRTAPPATQPAPMGLASSSAASAARPFSTQPAPVGSGANPALSAVRPPSPPAPVTLASNPATASGRGTTVAPGFVTDTGGAVAPATAPNPGVLAAAAESSTSVSAVNPAGSAPVAVASMAAAPAVPAPIAPPPPIRPAQDSVLARIIANLSIPAAELNVAPGRARASVAEARARAAEDSAERRAAVRRLASAEPLRAETGARRRRGTTEADAGEDEGAAPAARTRTGSAAPGRRRGSSAELAEAEAPVRTSVTRDRRGRRVVRTEIVEADAPGATSSARSRRGQVDADEATPRAGKRGAKTELAAKDTATGGRGSRNRKDEDEDTGKAGKGSTRTASGRDGKTEGRADKAEAGRVWVQVATGARDADLPKAWSTVRNKAPEVFKGRSGYATPLRSTNRVVTGPFKTQAEAQAFVNGLAKKGVAASTFTSDAGQKIAKLPTDK
ncbi:SPOR domain-containing protein [Sphingomonas aerophila]|uniref:Tetratricopeptide (TPR) repeat protein n=1 Tax=Sphingomonas aerophila TaxID=1344948 RepID=A0A7W9BEQ1_9SPHN|nr:tetratricopeptide (TPR) repeat protein [Sphingomonas aerophila]